MRHVHRIKLKKSLTRPRRNGSMHQSSDNIPRAGTNIRFTAEYSSQVPRALWTEVLALVISTASPESVSIMSLFKSKARFNPSLASKRYIEIDRYAHFNGTIDPSSFPIKQFSYQILKDLASEG